MFDANATKVKKNEKTSTKLLLAFTLIVSHESRSGELHSGNKTDNVRLRIRLGDCDLMKNECLRMHPEISES